MSAPVSVGYVCHRSGGHAVLFGDPDDCCGSKAVADIVIVPRPGYDIEGVDFEEAAKSLADTVREAWTLLEAKRWENYDASRVGDES